MSILNCILSKTENYNGTQFKYDYYKFFTSE